MALAIDSSTSEHIARAQKLAARFADQADLSLVIGDDGLLLYASPGWGELLGETAGVGIGLPFPNPSLALSIGEAGRRCFAAHLEALGAGGAREPIAFACTHPERGRRFYEGHAYVLQDEPGMLVLLHDATARWRDLLALAENERRFGTVAAATLDMVTETDFASGKFTYVSEAVRAVLGYAPEELVGTSALELHHPEQVDDFVATVKAPGAVGDPFQVAPHRLRRRDGSWIWVEATGVRYLRPDGRGRVIGVARDITARIESEETREALEARLQRSQKLESLGVLAGGIAHDFNNLLTPVVGAVGLLQQDLPDGSPLRRLVETIQVAADHARVLTDQMLSFAGETALQYKIVEIDRIVERMSRLLETMVVRSATIVVRCSEDVPPIRADAGQIGQVVVNLVVNASEALPPGGGRVEIRTGVVDADRALLDSSNLGESLEEGRYVVLEVEDEGEGIDEKALDRILDPFYTTKFTGRGLGLAVVLGIVRRHDGCIRIQSGSERGTLFQVLLPAADAALPVSPQRSLTVDAGEAVANGTILVVDDDEGARDLTATVLERAGFTVHTATSGPAALETFSRHHAEIDGVVLDATMPEMSGSKVFDAIRAIDAEARILLVSGHARERDAAALFERGLASFLHKPFDVDQLLAEVQSMLSEDRLDRSDPARAPSGGRSRG